MLPDLHGWIMRMSAERATHVGFAATSFGHRISLGGHGMGGGIAVNNNASTATLKARWATVAYALRRISRLFSFHEANMLVKIG